MSNERIELYFNGKIISVDGNENIYDYVAIKDGKIVEVGNGEPKAEYKNKYDLKGKTMLPGLYDAHCHVMSTGFFLNSANLLDVKSINETLEKLNEYSKGNDEEWIFGSGFMSQNIKEQRYPTRDELDKVSKDRPIMIASQTLHGGSLNTKALSRVNVPDDIGVEKDSSGNPTGVMKSDDAFFSVMGQIMSLLPEKTLKKFITESVDYAVKKGVTSIIGLMGQFCDKDLDIAITEKYREEFPIDITVFFQTWDLEKIKPYNYQRIGGCLTLDGAGFEYTMALNDVYPDRPHQRGFLIHTDQEIYELVSEAHKNNIQTAFHALGDRAIDQLIYIYKQVIGEQGKKDLRHRIEHFSLPTKKHIEMAIELDLILSMQPAFTGLWGDPENGYYIDLLGKERAKKMEYFNEIIQSGGIVCGGSDSPVTLIDPLYGIACLLDNPDPERNVSVHDALKIFTYNSAYSVHEEKTKGSIEIGKDADFTIIDKDPYKSTKNKDFYSTKVLMTVKKGEVIYSV